MKNDVAAPTLGTLAGLLALDHHGVPWWFLGLMLTASLVAGIFAANGRISDAAARADHARVAKSEAAALWIMAFIAVQAGDMSLPAAMGTALALGLLGTRALRAIEKRFLNKLVEE